MIYYTNKKKNSDRALWQRIGMRVGLLAVLVAAFFVLQSNSVLAPEPMAQVSGDWVGVLTEDYDANVRYDFRLRVIQEDHHLAGELNFSSSNSSQRIMARSAVTGTVDGDLVTLREIDLIELHGISATSWCWIEITLDYDDLATQDTLVGTWHGIETPGVERCLPTQGRVVLSRQ